MADSLRPGAILETCLYSSNLGVTRRFYSEVLGLELVFADTRNAFFRVGDGMLLLFDPDRTLQPGSQVNGAAIPTHGTAGPGHVAFKIAPDELDQWVERLEEQGVEIESLVDWPRGGRSLYVRDPAGNSVELAEAAIWR